MFSAGTSVWISFRAQDLTIWPKLRFLTTSDPSLVMPGNNVANVMEVCKRVLKIHVSLALRPISYKMCAPLTDMCALCSSLRVPERRLMRDLHRYTDHQLIGLFFSDSTHSTASFFMTFPSIVGFYILVFLSSCRPRGWFFPYHKDPNSIFAVTLSESTVIWGQWPVAPLDSDRFSIKALCCFFLLISTMSLNEFPPPNRVISSNVGLVTSLESWNCTVDLSSTGKVSWFTKLTHASPWNHTAIRTFFW